MPRLFGTDGVRGMAGTELTCQLAFDLGRAGAYVLTSAAHKPRILVGRDTRISGQMLESALVSGICSIGATAIIVDVMPTPAVAWLTRRYHADAGVVISASHNPMEDNGIKFFSREGFKLPDHIEDEIERHIKDGCRDIPVAIGADVGRLERLDQADEEYIEYVIGRTETDLCGLKVVLDCANGAAFNIAPRVFTGLGADVISVFDRPDGVNINRECGSTHMEHLCAIVKEVGADVGLAFDGDADRCLAVDETGRIIDGDRLMMICALECKKQGRLPQDTLVVTVMSNMGLDIAAREQGIRLEKTGVGDRYVLEKMLEKGYSVGGEASGHIIFLEDNTTGDGLITGVNALASMKRNGKKLSQLAEVMTVLPQVLIGVTVEPERKLTWNQDEKVIALIAQIEGKLEGRGRVLVRASGTEPLIRIMLEGEDVEQLNEYANAIAQVI